MGWQSKALACPRIALLRRTQSSQPPLPRCRSRCISPYLPSVRSSAYWWGSAGKTVPTAQPQLTATAIVHIHDADAVRRRRLESPYSGSCPARQEVLSQENLDRTAREIQSAASAGRGSGEEPAAAKALARLREKLGVEVAAEGKPGATRITILLLRRESQHGRPMGQRPGQLLCRGVSSAMADAGGEGLSRRPGGNGPGRRPTPSSHRPAGCLCQRTIGPIATEVRRRPIRRVVRRSPRCIPPRSRIPIGSS